jgi:hypothetical protein
MANAQWLNDHPDRIGCNKINHKSPSKGRDGHHSKQKEKTNETSTKIRTDLLC